MVVPVIAEYVDAEFPHLKGSCRGVRCWYPTRARPTAICQDAHRQAQPRTPSAWELSRNACLADVVVSEAGFARPADKIRPPH